MAEGLAHLDLLVGQDVELKVVGRLKYEDDGRAQAEAAHMVALGHGRALGQPVQVVRAGVERLVAVCAQRRGGVHDDVADVVGAHGHVGKPAVIPLARHGHALVEPEQAGHRSRNHRRHGHEVAWRVAQKEKRKEKERKEKNKQWR